jgi:hypothetical protein
MTFCRFISSEEDPFWVETCDNLDKEKIKSVRCWSIFLQKKIF